MTNTKNTVSDELLPCPFCGGEAKVKYVYNTSSICCADCCSSTAFFRDTDTAISVWNRRAASIPGGVGVKVKPLEWHKSEIIGWNGDWHTVPTAYSIRCADENGWKWSGFGGFGYTRSDTEAKAAAQADYEHRILSALE